MTECIQACQELWKKKIYTFMTSNYQDYGNIWIEIPKEISPENFDILKSLKSMGIKTYIYHNNCYTFAVDGSGKEASNKLLQATKMFKMQDVPKNIAYQPEEDFLISCGCYKKELNPEYIEMNFSSIEEQKKYMDEYNAWKNSPRSQKYIIEYDPSKKEKTTADYAREHNKILDSGRVYKSEYDYKKHLVYEDYIKAEIEYSSHYENGVETINDNNIIKSKK